VHHIGFCLTNGLFSLGWKYLTRDDKPMLH
jgi:hypothetical protein